MLKERPKTWAIFAVVCLSAYLVAFVVAPWAFTGITKLNLISKYESTLTEDIPQSTEPSDEESKVDAASDIANNALNVLSKMATYIGITIVVFGIFQFVLAFSQDDSDRVSAAIRILIIGAMLCGASFILPSLINGGFDVKN